MTNETARDQLVDSLLALVRPEIENLIEERVARRLPKPSPWLNTEQAAEYLGITAAAVHKRVARGKLKAHYDAGGKLRFRRDELDESMDPW